MLYRAAVEVRDTSRIESELQEMRNQIADLQRQFEVFRLEAEEVAFHTEDAEKKAAFGTICRLPSNVENPITCGFASAYRYGSGGKELRVSFSYI